MFASPVKLRRLHQRLRNHLLDFFSVIADLASPQTVDPLGEKNLVLFTYQSMFVSPALSRPVSIRSVGEETRQGAAGLQ